MLPVQRIVSISNYSILNLRGQLDKILDLVADAQPADEAELDAYITGLCFTTVCQKLKSSRWESPLLHFLARCGIHPREARFIDAHEYSQTLAAVIFGVRMLVYYHLTLTANRELNETSLYSELEKVHREYLHDRSNAPMGEMLSLLAYAMGKAKAGSGRPCIVWGSGETVYFRGDPVSKAGLKTLAQSLLAKTKDCLQRHLLFNSSLDLADIDLTSIRDDMTDHAARFSFLVDRRNVALNTIQHQFMCSILYSNEVGLKLFTPVDGEYFWRPNAVGAYLQNMQEFLKLLAVLIHITAGQPARATELLSMHYANTATAIRNVYVQDGQVMIVLDYHKSRELHGKSKPRVYFLPKAVGELLVTYLLCVIPFAQLLYHRTHQTPPEALSKFVFVHLTKDMPLPTKTLTETLKSETLRAMGWPITTAAWRHVVIEWKRKLRFDPDDTLEDEEDDDDDNIEDINDLQAGHTSAIARKLYGVRADMAQSVTPELIARFRLISEEWHTFLGLRELTTNSRGPPPTLHEPVGPSTALQAPHSSCPAQAWHTPAGSANQDFLADFTAEDFLDDFTTPDFLTSSATAGPSNQSTSPLTPPRQTNPDDSPTSHPTPTTEDNDDITPQQPSMAPSTPHRANRRTLVITPRKENPPPVKSALQNPLMGQLVQRRAATKRTLEDSADVQPPTKRSKPFLDGSWENIKDRPEEAALKGLRLVLGAEAHFKTKMQEEALTEVVQANPGPLLMVLPTGAGKSLLFMAPAALPLALVTVVIVPYVALRANLEAKAKAAGVAYASFKSGFRAVVPLVFASVEQLSYDLPHYLRAMHETSQLQRIVVDEAHVMLTEWGFRDKGLKQLKRVADFCATCQVLLLTATLPPSLDKAIAEAYCLPNLVIRRHPTRRPNLMFDVKLIEESTQRYDRQDHNRELIADEVSILIQMDAKLESSERGIIFVPSIQDTMLMKRLLEEQGALDDAQIYHSALQPADKTKALSKWLRGGGWILSTKALGAGVDYPNVKAVIHAGFCHLDSLLEYTQQVGRAGRGCAEGLCYAVALRRPNPGTGNAMGKGKATDCYEERLHEYLHSRECRRSVLHAFIDGDRRACMPGELLCDNCMRVHPFGFILDQSSQASEAVGLSQASEAAGLSSRASEAAGLSQASEAAGLSSQVSEAAGLTSLESTAMQEDERMNPHSLPVKPQPFANHPRFITGGARLLAQSLEETKWQLLQTALRQVNGQCFVCYTQKSKQYEHGPEHCSIPGFMFTKHQKLTGAIRRSVHFERNICCFSCLLPKSACEARFERRPCENPKTLLGLAVALHLMYQWQLGRHFVAEAYPPQISWQVTPQNSAGEPVGTSELATWLGKSGQMGEEPVVNAMRVVMWAIMKLKIVR